MPRILGSVPADRWEQEVRRQLQRQLPTDWIVVCNIAWALPDDRGVVRDGQCDFVVLAPGFGMAIVEVKGSRSVRIAEDGRWYRQEYDRRTGQPSAEVCIDEPPPEQACRNMHTLRKHACRQLGWDGFPGAYAFIVIYPQGVIHEKSANYDATTIVTSHGMPQLAKALRAALQARAGQQAYATFTPAVAERVATLLSGAGFRISGADTVLHAQEDAHDIDLLTRQQYAAVRGAFDLPRVAVLGPAGSGKTMLALWKLEALIEEGKRALYVCFNKNLASRLRLTNAAMQPFIKSVDALFVDLAGPPRQGAHDATFFNETLPNVIIDKSAAMSDEEKYDAIIVDEGQDFGDTRLMALYWLLRQEGQWLVFADHAQDVYRRHGEVVGTEVTFRLFHNCRNTELVNDATNRLCAQSVQAMPGVPKGSAPEVIHCSSTNVMAQRAWEVANRLEPGGGAVMLSPFRLENSCMREVPIGYGMRLSQEINDLQASGTVFFSTIRSFKGLEARSVILLHGDVPGTNQAFMPEDLYVACTRATGRLVILTTSTTALRQFSEATSRVGG